MSAIAGTAAVLVTVVRATDGPLIDARVFDTLNIEYIQHRTFRCDFPRALGDGFRQQAFQPFQVVELGADIFEMMRGDLTDLSTCSLFWSAKAHQRSDFL